MFYPYFLYNYYYQMKYVFYEFVRCNIISVWSLFLVANLVAVILFSIRFSQICSGISRDKTLDDTYFYLSLSLSLSIYLYKSIHYLSVSFWLPIYLSIYIVYLSLLSISHPFFLSSLSLSSLLGLVLFWYFCGSDRTLICL